MRHRFQFRLATLLLLVTLSAIGIDYCRRRARLLQFAELHAAEAATRLSMSRSRKGDWWFSVMSRIPTDEEWAQGQERDRQLAIHHQELAAKYRRGAWLPWLIEPRDAPPEPFTLETLLESESRRRRSVFTLFK
jgi:hypothetical protein